MWDWRWLLACLALAAHSARQVCADRLFLNYGGLQIIPAQADLLESTVSDISEWGLGDDHAAPVMIAGVDSPALEWTLRDHQVFVVKSLDISSAPYFVITPLQDDPVACLCLSWTGFHLAANSFMERRLAAGLDPLGVFA